MNKVKITITFYSIIEAGETPESIAAVYKDLLSEATSDYTDNFHASGVVLDKSGEE